MSQMLGRHMIYLLGVVASAMSLGCQARQSTADGSSETGDGGCKPFDVCEECTVIGLPPRGIDILVVVDGSIGSAGAQTRLAAGLEQLVAELDANENGLDYRIAITTTDMGPPACDPLVTTPEFGRFVDSSCRERLTDFVDANGQDFSSSCTDACSLEVIERVPTKIAEQAEPAARPWIERDGGQSNLSAEIDLLEALRCTAMVGVTGCRFESPLAAIEAAVLGSRTEGHPNFGFFRPASRWGFVIVSDAEDCSWTETGLAIFDPAGERTFWSDPQADAPTPAVCWNAGTECTDSNGQLDCVAANYNVHGDAPTLSDPMVLQTPEYFSAPLETSDEYGWHNDMVLFSGLTLDGELVYAQAQDPAFAIEHGIGPGCDDQAGTVALPPVRTLRFLRRFRDLDDADVFLAEHAESICAPDFGPTLAALGERMRVLDRQNCYSGYACDEDPSTELLDVQCEVTASSWGSLDVFDIPECARGDDGAYLVDPDTGRAAMPDADTDLCYLARVDAQQLTPDPLDDAWPDCRLGIDLITRDGRAPDEYIVATCTMEADAPL